MTKFSPDIDEGKIYKKKNLKEKKLNLLNLLLEKIF
jgi:hypothetical protein